jgi:hypothetical protein
MKARVRNPSRKLKLDDDNQGKGGGMRRSPAVMVLLSLFLVLHLQALSKIRTT